LILATRLDIAFPVIKLSRYTSNPSEQHIVAGKRIFRYLSKYIDTGITLSSDNSNELNRYISGYCDSDFAGDIATAKSTTGYVFLLANGPISWKSKLQSIVAQSTTEAEYIAINTAVKEAIYIKQLLSELGHYNQNKFPIYTDNNGALLLAQNPIFHERTKHIAVKYHYIRHQIDNGIIDIIWVPSEKQKADGLTKPLDKNKFESYLSQIGLK
jgi:hypothetical protein